MKYNRALEARIIFSNGEEARADEPLKNNFDEKHDAMRRGHRLAISRRGGLKEFPLEGEEGGACGTRRDFQWKFF